MGEQLDISSVEHDVDGKEITGKMAEGSGNATGQISCGLSVVEFAKNTGYHNTQNSCS